MTKRQGILVAVMIILGVVVSLAQAAEFSADIITKTGGQTMRGKIYMKGKKVRQEFSNNMGMPGISILRPDKKVIWLLMPSEKMYMEMPMNGSPHGQVRPGRGQTPGKMYIEKPKMKMKLIGTETVSGYLCNKYEFMEPAEGNKPPKKHYIWISQKLKMPLRVSAADGSFFMEYKNIKTGGVDDSLFEIPSGYKKMTIPFGMTPMK